MDAQPQTGDGAARAGTAGEAARRASPANIHDGEIRNLEPATGKPLPPVKVATPAEVRQAVGRAREAQARWAALSWGERERKLLRFRDHLIEKADVVYDSLVRENGKPRFEALTHEVFPIVDLIHFFARNAGKILADERIPLHLFGPLKKSYLRYEPRGVIGVISPWNFPFTLPMGDVIMALAARNAVVVKPSEWTPGTMLRARELMVESGIDPDLVAVVPGGGATGAALVEAGVDMVIFTGSVGTGRKVGMACAERLIPYVAELGGKNPALVLPDADPDEVAQYLVWGAFANSGQVCASIERVLLPDGLHDAVLARVVELTKRLRQGPPVGPADVDVGAMVFPVQLEIVKRHVEDARAKGARILTGGRAFGEGGARFYEPTVLADVTDEMVIWNEETFGPVMPIRRYRDVEEAIRLANDTDMGLQAYVFGGSAAWAEQVAQRIRAGSVIVNDWCVNHAMPETPWGGVKSSGLGRVHGLQGLKDLCEIRHICRPRVAMKPPWMFPYREGVFRAMSKGLASLYKSFLGWFV